MYRHILAQHEPTRSLNSTKSHANDLIIQWLTPLSSHKRKHDPHFDTFLTFVAVILSNHFSKQTTRSGGLFLKKQNRFR